MPIAIRCPNPPCGRLLHLAESPEARRVKCPACGARFTIDPSSTSFAWGEGRDQEPIETRKAPETVSDPARTEAGSAEPTPEGSLAADRTERPPEGAPTVDLGLDRTERGPEGAPTLAPSSGDADLTTDWSADVGERPTLKILEARGPEDDVYDVRIEASEPGLPDRIGRFRLIRTLGVGAFGTVYLAFDTQLEREVALKVPRASGTTLRRQAAEVLREARAAARLRHPRIVPIFEVGSADGFDYIASAFIDGRSMDAEMAEGTLGPDDPVRVARIVRDLAEALYYAHGQGIVHRDVKPGNVLLDASGRPHLTDFGLAVRTEDSSRGGVAGTPTYMSPEQATGDEARPSSDQYSLGVILYQLLCGQPPFAGSISMVLQAVVHDEPAPPGSIRRDTPAELEAICLKAMAKTPGHRFRDCRAMAEALRRWLHSQAGAAGSRSDGIIQWIERLPGLGWLPTPALRRAIGGLIVTAALMGFGGLAWLTVRSVGELFGEESLRVVRLTGIEADVRPRWSSLAPGPLGDLAFEPGDSGVLVLGPRGLGRWDLETGRQISWNAEEPTPFRALAVSPDGTWLAIGADDGVLVVRDREGGQDRHRIAAHAGMISALAFSPDGSRIASASADHSAKLWNAESGREEVTLRGHTEGLRGITFSPDGEQVVTAGDSRAILWDARSGEEIRAFEGHRGTVTGVAVHPDGHRLATSSADRSVRLWDVGSGLARIELRGDDRPLTAVRWSPDGRHIAASEGDAPDAPASERPAALRLWDAESGQPNVVLRGKQGAIDRLAFGSGGDDLISLSPDGSLECWAVEPVRGR